MGRARGNLSPSRQLACHRHFWRRRPASGARLAAKATAPAGYAAARLYKLHAVSAPAGKIAMSQSLQIHTIESMPFSENTYVVWRPGRTDALVIDPGLEPELVVEFLQEHGLRPAAILNTHGHADH